MIKKLCNQYYLSVEGETEKWYFEYLQKLINSTDEIPYKVKFDIKICKSIISRAKTITAIYSTKAFHICDYESNETEHIMQFEKVLRELKDVKNINKKIQYKLGYSNFSFELWIILHKIEQKTSINNRKQYIKGINKAYNENFLTIDEYKEEKNFKKILKQITLEDVIFAINNGNKIRKMNCEKFRNNYRKYLNFEYYKENPDMTINECVELILKECKVIKS